MDIFKEINSQPNLLTVQLGLKEKGAFGKET